MEEQAHHMESMAEELARKDQQLERLRQAYLELQNSIQQQQQVVNNNGQPNINNKDNIWTIINHLPTFTGTGEVTINSFLSSTEYLLSSITDEDIKKEVVRTIFYKVIQGQAKDVIINIPQPDNWQLIKETLKLRYRPDVEPHQLYRTIANLKVNTVSELIVELQKIKYKADELIIYYQGQHCIDLSNIDSLLVNTVKEMTQGTLLDKTYEENNINDILRILTRRRFEDTCIRPEYRKFNRNIRNNNNIGKNNFNQNKQNYTQQGYPGQYNIRQPNNHNNYHNTNMNRNFNNSGQYRLQNNGFNNPSGNFQRFREAGHPRPKFNQDRWNQARQSPNEPMEVDNLEVVYSNQQFPPVGHPRGNVSQYRLTPPRQDRTEYIDLRDINMNNGINHNNNNINCQKFAQLGNPRPNNSQYRFLVPRQERNEFFGQESNEINNNQMTGYFEPNPAHGNVGQPRQNQDQFFQQDDRTTYPS